MNGTPFKLGTFVKAGVRPFVAIVLGDDDGARLRAEHDAAAALVARLEDGARALLGVRAIGARGCKPELAFDADTYEDYLYASAIA